MSGIDAYIGKLVPVDMDGNTLMRFLLMGSEKQETPELESCAIPDYCASMLI